MSSRLNGRAVKCDEKTEGLFVHTHASMTEAVGFARKGTADFNANKGRSRDPAKQEARDKLNAGLQVAFVEALNGNALLPRLVEQADALMDEVILVDPRLNRKHGWVHAEEGIDADAALVSAGEPNCCIDRRRLKVAEAATGEPVRIVISTDSTDDASNEHVVAFIAAARLAQQFRPLEIWWQGSWLNENNTNLGSVLLAPLIQGDMDFARVQFFLSHPLRDRLSYRCGWYHWATVPSGGSFKNGGRKMKSFGGARATYSHLPDTFDFITEKGIPTRPSSVAELAAKWAGLESAWHLSVDGNEARQYWRPEPVRGTGTEPVETLVQRRDRERRAADDQQRWEAQRKERERREKEEAAERLNA